MHSVIKIKRKLECRKRCKKKRHSIQLIDLPWEDILFTYIFPLLTVKDLCRFQGASKSFRALYCAFLRQCAKLDFSSTNITSEAFYEITQHCENLRWLSISKCPIIEDDGICELFTKNAMLQYINMSSCPYLTQASLQVCAVNCSSLKGLWLGDCHWLQSGGLQVIMLHLQDLQHLDISYCWDVEEGLLKKLLMKYSSLIELSLNYIESVTDSILGCLSSHCKGLKILHLRGCWRITEAGIQKVIEWCPNLKVLDIRSCRNITLKYMCKLHLKNMTVLADYSLTQLMKRRRNYTHIDLNLQI